MVRKPQGPSVEVELIMDGGQRTVFYELRGRDFVASEAVARAVGGAGTVPLTVKLDLKVTNDGVVFVSGPIPVVGVVGGTVDGTWSARIP